MKKVHRNIAWGLLALAGLALVSAGCSGSTGAEERNSGRPGTNGKGTDPKVEEAVPVEVSALGRGAIEAVLRYSTNLEAEESVGVYSQAARQVRELAVEEGRVVQKGQLLLRLQDEEQRTLLAKSASQLARAEREYERQQRLHAGQMISEQAFNNATYDLEQLKLAHEEALRELSYTEVRAPISGTITERLVSLGDHVMVNQHLFDIVDFSSIVARVYVPEKELPRLRNGQLARLSSAALGPQVYTGRVERLAPIVDPKSGTVKVTVALPDTVGLAPGMFVDVELVTATRTDALLVPKRALVYDNDQVFVYRLENENRVHRVLLRPVLEDKEHVEPAPGLGGAGLSPGDRVVIAGQAGLKEGGLVRVLEAQTAGVPGLGAPAPEAGATAESRR